MYFIMGIALLTRVDVHENSLLRQESLNKILFFSNVFIDKKSYKRCHSKYNRLFIL